jgi:hypothetical protein
MIKVTSEVILPPDQGLSVKIALAAVICIGACFHLQDTVVTQRREHYRLLILCINARAVLPSSRQCRCQTTRCDVQFQFRGETSFKRARSCRLNVSPATVIFSACFKRLKPVFIVSYTNFLRRVSV